MNKIPALFLVALHILPCHALMDTSLLDEVIVKALQRLEDIPRGLSDPAATGTAFLQFGLSQDTAASTHEFREISIYPRTYSQWYERARAQLCMHRHTHAAPRRAAPRARRVSCIAPLGDDGAQARSKVHLARSSSQGCIGDVGRGSKSLSCSSMNCERVALRLNLKRIGLMEP